MPAGKQLLVAEKPSVARAVAAVLGSDFGRHDGPGGLWHLENGAWVVAALRGHVAELAEPEDYDPAMGRWSLAMLPIMPATFLARVRAEQEGVFRLLRQLMRRRDVSAVVNACDAGREGELIFRLLYALAGCRLPVKRLWLSDQTPDGIRRALRDLRPAAELEELAAAAVSRSEADWLVGINATRAFTLRYGGRGEVLSVGRVQTPTLAILVRREEEIRRFRSEAFWEVWARFVAPAGEYEGRWFSDDADRFADRTAAEGVVARVREAAGGRVESATARKVADAPPLPYNLNDLQRDANRLFGHTAKHTLDLAQALYERGAVTYPRTDSRHLTAALAGTLPERFRAVAEAGGDLRELVAHLPYPLPMQAVDDAGVSDHHALIPTVQPLRGGSQEETEVYRLVARRFLAAFYPPAVFRHTRVVTVAAGERFLSRSRELLEPGWRCVYGEVPGGDDGILARLSPGDDARVADVLAREKRTEPPSRFTEAGLLAAMETAGKLIEDEALREAMKRSGLGTPATRASVIEGLVVRGYVVRRGKILLPTEKGEALVRLVPEVLRSPEMTGAWERRLQDMAEGRESREEFMADARRLAAEVVAHACGAFRTE
jgi:DNA topoisomerase-3